ncbi:MAG TPA: restriction endonuclease subunit R, partial [Vicinamibacteria bacterium]|nr:restriction endonuclease subunit R [Vicinamibacteria bacterium]
NPPLNPLPFVYLSTGVETAFINLLDPDPRSRRISGVPHIHRPATLAEWLGAEPRVPWPARAAESGAGVVEPLPSTLRSRLLALPPLEPAHLYPNQMEARAKPSSP